MEPQKLIHKVSKCKCCGHNKIDALSPSAICMWCMRDFRNYALFVVFPRMDKLWCSFYETGEMEYISMRFCKTCHGALIHHDDIVEYLIAEYDTDEECKSPDEYMEFIRLNCFDQYRCLAKNTCECYESDDSGEYYSLEEMQKIQRKHNRKLIKPFLRSR